MFAAGSVDSTFEFPLEGWGASVDALSNKIDERCSYFQAPLLPSRWYPLQLAEGKKLPTRHIGCRVLPIDRPFRD